MVCSRWVRAGSPYPENSTPQVRFDCRHVSCGTTHRTWVDSSCGPGFEKRLEKGDREIGDLENHDLWSVVVGLLDFAEKRTRQTSSQDLPKSDKQLRTF